MESIWFILTVPVFYIIGLVAFVRWCLNGGRSANTAERQKLAANLRVRADGLSGEARKALLNVADDFSMGLLPDVPAAAPGTAALSPAGMPPTHAAQTPASSSSWTSQDIEAVFAKLDNINVLLYLGAFLIVVSAGIFVGANFSTLSGGFKTGFLALFTALFYGVGLTLYLRFAKLRPAGAVFTAIGLILIPMVGLAAYNFTSAHEVGRLLWFGTSLIALGAYVLTLLVTRQTYVAYLMGFTTLSLFESSISLINLPLQWFGWGMTVVALLLLLASRRAGWWQDAASALRICAHLFVPISVLFSLGVINSQGWGQVGITLGLAGFFYGVLAYREAATPSGAVYWVLAAAALPAGLAVGLHDLLPASQLALLLCVTSLAYAWLGWAARRPLPHQWREYLGIVAGVTPLLAAGLAYSSPTTILYALLTGIGVSAFFALTLRQAALALLALLPAWIVPYELFRQVMMPAADWGYVAAGYVVLGCLLVAWRRLLTGWPDSGDQVGITGYAVAFGLATCTAVIGGSTVLFWTSLALGAAIYLVGYLERSIACVYLAAAFGYLAAWQLVDIGQQPTSVGAIILLLAGAAIYASEFLARDADRGQALRYAGLTGPFLGALFTAGTASDSLAPIA
ncbi:MAG TPA: hypothetical protein VLF67_00525, partial [Candidatus Saccharimonas sp.]|nr:hypothetical protein [Candidatus Saccharimonas sp.]